MSHQEFIQAVIDSLNSESEEIRQRGQINLNKFINDPNTIKICFEILMTNPDERYQKYAAVYAHKVIKTFWKNLDLQIRAEIQAMAMQILSNRNFSEEITDNFLDSIKYIYSHDQTYWPDLMNYMQSINNTVLCLMIARRIISKMHADVITSSKDFFMALSLNAMINNNLNMQLLGVNIFHQYVARYMDNPGSQNHIPVLIQILMNSKYFSEKDMQTVWSCLHDILIYDCVSDEAFTQILPIAFDIAQDRAIQPQNRYIPLLALVPKIDSFNQEMIMKIFTLSIDINAAMIERDGSINDPTLDFFNTTSDLFEHQTLYPLIQNRIQEAFNSNSISHQISGLLIFKILLKSFPDLVFNDIETVISFLSNALSSPNDLLKEASLRVIETLTGSFKSSNAYSIRFLPLILQNLLSTSPEVSVHAFTALYNIFHSLDTKIPGFLDKYLQLFSQVPPDNIVHYLSALALIIESAEDFNDENCDQIVNLISQIIQTQDPGNISICLQISIALLHQDETQFNFIVQSLFPFVGQFLQNPIDRETTDETFDFIGNLSDYLREKSIQYFQPLIPLIIQYLDNKSITNEVKSGIVINIAKLTKFCGKTVPALVDHLIPVIKDGLESDEEDFQTQSAVSIKKIKDLLNPQAAQLLFLKLIQILGEASDYDDYLEEFLLAASKLLIIADKSNVQLFLSKVVEFVQSIFNNTWLLLKERPLLQSPKASDILPPLCHLFSAIFHYPTPINDSICQFLTQWIAKNSQIDLAEVVGTLSDCLEFKNVSEQTRQLILNSIIQIMNTATEPSLIQNLTYLMNVLVQDANAINLLPRVVELIPIFEKWRQVADNSKYGFQEVIANIASLYLQIAIRYPQFPDKYIIFAIQQFPPFDINETFSMAQAILNLLNTKQNPEIFEQSALAITRFFVQEDSRIEKAKLTDQLKVSMIQFLKTICSQQNQIFMKIRASYGRQKSKIKKIEALLNS